jgi:hypothetical protein
VAPLIEDSGAVTGAKSAQAATWAKRLRQ